MIMQRSVKGQPLIYIIAYWQAYRYVQCDVDDGGSSAVLCC